MFYVEDDENELYVKKTDDEVTEDLMRIMQNGNKEGNSVNEGDNMFSNEVRPKNGMNQEKVKKPHIEILDSNDFSNNRRSEEFEITNFDDNSVNEAKLDEEELEEETLEEEEDLDHNHIKAQKPPNIVKNDEDYLSEEELTTPKLARKERVVRLPPANKLATTKFSDDEEEENGEEENGEENGETDKNYKRVMKPNDQIALNPVPKEEGLVKCYIIREKGKFSLFPKYFLYVERDDEDVFLMSAKKRGSNKTSNYCICTDKKHINRDHKSYIGKLRANVLGTKFYIYDKGENEENSLKTRSKVRKQLGAILYESNILGTRGPRKMTVLIPKTNENGKYKKFSDKKGNKLIDIYQKKGDWGSINIYKNKSPSYNDNLKAYVLNFNGRVTKPSVKNFQLVNPQQNDVVSLQFGRISDNKFNLDFRHPISPFQAFSVALSAFDFKLGCE